ncbi:hypothetical protein HZ99_01415 [Pseudomonas fluorescens]|nr:hypothetical protein HZ99_01415 [Pseudomonas fluorescens]
MSYMSEMQDEFSRGEYRQLKAAALSSLECQLPQHQEGFDQAFAEAATPGVIWKLVEKHQALIAENERLQKTRIPAGFYRELAALRELRDQAKKYVDSYLLDEVEDAEFCVSEDQHLCATALSECLMDAFEAHWDSAMASASTNAPGAK